MIGIVLDTCVVSENNKQNPSQMLVSWLNAQRLEFLYLTSTVIAEVAEGIARMPIGRRRRLHEGWLDSLVNSEFSGRILMFDTAAALTFGRIVAASYAMGRPPGFGDAQIAAVAALHGMTVATRDISGFEPFGVPLVNPWE
jgi:toxin FitB